MSDLAVCLFVSYVCSRCMSDLVVYLFASYVCSYVCLRCMSVCSYVVVNRFNLACCLERGECPVEIKLKLAKFSVGIVVIVVAS